MNYAGYLIVGLFGIGMGLAFLVADPEAATSPRSRFSGASSETRLEYAAVEAVDLKGFSAPVPAFALRAIVL